MLKGLLQICKSLITEVRGRTRGASPFTQTSRVEILCIKMGTILQTRKSLITEVRGRTGGARHLYKPPGGNLVHKKGYNTSNPVKAL